MDICMWFNSLWPSDAIWRQRSESTLIQVMVCCLAAPNHHLNQHWFIISKVLTISWRQFCRKFSRYLPSIWVWKITHSTLQLHFSGSNELMGKWWWCIIGIDTIIIYHYDLRAVHMLKLWGFQMAFAAIDTYWNLNQFWSELWHENIGPGRLISGLHFIQILVFNDQVYSKVHMSLITPP